MLQSFNDGDCQTNVASGPTVIVPVIIYCPIQIWSAFCCIPYHKSKKNATCSRSQQNTLPLEKPVRQRILLPGQVADAEERIQTAEDGAISAEKMLRIFIRDGRVPSRRIARRKADYCFPVLGYRSDGIDAVDPSGLPPALFRRFPPIIHVSPLSLSTEHGIHPWVKTNLSVS